MKKSIDFPRILASRAVLIFLTMLCLFFCWTRLIIHAEENTENESVFSSVSDLNGKTIGVQTGSISDQAVERNVKNATIQYFETESDEVIAVQQGKIDAGIVDEPVGRLICLNHPDLALMDKCLEDDEYGIMFQKNKTGEALRDKLNQFIEACFSDGTIDDMDKRWFSLDESGKKLFDYNALKGNNGTLKMGAMDSVEPFCYVKDDQLTGYTMELVYRFCEKYGYKLELDLCAWLLGSLLERVQIVVSPKERRNVLKGINTDISMSDDGVSKSRLKGEKGEAVIEIRDLKKVYPSATPLDGVSTTIRRGDVISIIGPSGTGKSTLLRCINRLEKPTEGSIFAFGQEIPDKGPLLRQMRTQIGMVFQSFNLFEHLTVIENLMLAPMVVHGVPRQQAYETGMQLLRRVGLAKTALHYPDQMSGGQKQRVAIVRTVAMHPQVILFDEPTSALDPLMVGEVLSVIRALAKAGQTMMVVTHEMSFAREVSNRVMYLDEGGIYEDGTPEQIFDYPQRAKTRDFVKHIKHYEYIITSPDFDFVELQTGLDVFAHMQLMDERLLLRLQLVVEELTMSGLVRSHDIKYPAKLSVEYSQTDKSCVVILIYKHPQMNVVDYVDELAMKLLSGDTQSIDYSYDENVNKITLTIKQ